MLRPLKHFIEWAGIVLPALAVTVFTGWLIGSFLNAEFVSISWLLTTGLGRFLMLCFLFFWGAFAAVVKSQNRHLLIEAWDENY